MVESASLSRSDITISDFPQGSSTEARLESLKWLRRDGSAPVKPKSAHSMHVDMTVVWHNGTADASDADDPPPPGDPGGRSGVQRPRLSEIPRRGESALAAERNKKSKYSEKIGSDGTLHGWGC